MNRTILFGAMGLSLIAGAQISAPAQTATRPSTQPASTNPSASTTQPADDPLAASVITMHYKGALLIDVLDDFSRQAHADLHVHNPIVLNAIQSQKVDLELDHVGFWQAAEKISTLSGLHLSVGNGMGGPIHWDQNGGNIGYSDDLALTRGSVTIVPQSISFMQTVQYDGRSPSPNFYLNFSLLAEPKVQIVSAPKEKWVSQMVDDKGKPIPVLNTNINAQEPWVWNLSANLRWPNDSATKIASIKGEFTVNLATKFEKVEINDLKAGSTHKIGNRTLTIKSLTPQQNNNVYELKMTVTGEPSTQAAMRNQSILSEFEVLDAQGDSLQSYNQGISGTSVVEININFFPMFVQGPNRQTGAPTKLIWTIPTETKPMVISYEFHDLDLPVRK